jgi:hypothetical protein
MWVVTDVTILSFPRVSSIKTQIIYCQFKEHVDIF